jgi:hypothetical protein
MRDITNQPCHAVTTGTWVPWIQEPWNNQPVFRHIYRTCHVTHFFRCHALHVIGNKRSSKRRCHAPCVTHFFDLSRTFNYVDTVIYPCHAWEKGILVTLFEKIDYAKQVWETFLPAVSVPDQKTLAYWSADYSTTEIDFAVSRTAKKFHSNARLAQQQEVAVREGELCLSK